MQQPERTWRIQDVLQWTRARFERQELRTPRLDAEVLLAHSLGCDRISLYTNYDKPLRPHELQSYRAAVARRLDREPVSYITGSREFWSIALAVDRRVLVPRPATETLIEQALLRLGEDAARVWDIGTGSGAIAIALLRERPALTALASDLSADALVVAQLNADSARVSDRLELRRGDLFEVLTPADAPFDLILSNPPYIPTGDLPDLEDDVGRYEPTAALDGGEDGLRIIARILADAGGHLGPGGTLLMEIGSDQAERVRRMVGEQPWARGAVVEVTADYEGHDRLLGVTLAGARKP